MSLSKGEERSLSLSKGEKRPLSLSKGLGEVGPS